MSFQKSVCGLRGHRAYFTVVVETLLVSPLAVDPWFFLPTRLFTTLFPFLQCWFFYASGLGAPWCHNLTPFVAPTHLAQIALPPKFLNVWFLCLPLVTMKPVVTWIWFFPLMELMLLVVVLLEEVYTRCI